MTSNNCGSQSITISILSLVFIVLKELSGLCWRMNPSQQRCNQRVACWSAYFTLHSLPTSSTLPHSCSHLLWSVCLVSSLSADIRGQAVILNLFSSLLFTWVLLTGVLRWVQTLYLLLVYLSMNTYECISLLTARFTLVYLIVPLTQLIQSPKGVLNNHVLMFRKPLWLILLSNSPSNLCLRKIGNADCSGRKRGVAFSLGCLSPTKYV